MPPKPRNGSGSSYNVQGTNLSGIAQGENSFSLGGDITSMGECSAPQPRRNPEENGLVVFTARELERKAVSSVFTSALGEVLFAPPPLARRFMSLTFFMMLAGREPGHPRCIFLRAVLPAWGELCCTCVLGRYRCVLVSSCR